MAQRDKVAHLLRSRPGGVHTFELRHAYIANPSERIRELKDRGWQIDCKAEKLHGTAEGTRYVKVYEPESASTAAPVNGGPAALARSGPALAGEDQAGTGAAVDAVQPSLFPEEHEKPASHYEEAA